MRVVATLPPYVGHRAAIIAHARIDALRFNTVSPLAEPKVDLLRRLRDECAGKPLWIDLKGRQLRVTRFAYLPFAYADINHRIRVKVPCELLLQDGVASVDAVVDGSRLILGDRPFRVLGDGEPVTILDPTLTVLDPLPERDREYIAAAREAGLHRYMLSFVEGEDDLARVRELDPDAEIVAKIESRRGMACLPKGRLMAARDDLYIQAGADKTALLGWLEAVVHADPGAMVASRFLESLLRDDAVSLADVSDLELMARMGYGTMMLGDGLCFRQEAFRRAMAVLDAWAG